MSRAGDVFAPLPREVEPLAPVLAAALDGLPGTLARDLPAHRVAVLAQPSDLATEMRRIEADAVAGGSEPRAVLELWAWIAYLAIVRGYRGTTTVAGYARNLALFLTWCREQRADFREIALDQLDGWMKWLYLQHRHGPRWRARQAAAVRSFYDWRHTRGLGENCAAGLKSPRMHPGVPRKYSMQQLQGMFAATASRRNPLVALRDRTILLMLLSTGMRREELHQLNLSDLEIGKTVGVVRIHGKGAKLREVSFEGPVVESLREWLLQRDQLTVHVEPDAVFLSLAPGTVGQRLAIQGFEAIVKRCAKLAKVRDWGVHRFRVTFATALYDAGKEIEEIRILLGHESIETTRRYLSVSERARRTRLSSTIQHQALGTRAMGQPRWVQAALGGAKR